MRTNTPPNGAFRGFGAPQTQFAVEVHMDRIAEQLGIDPVTLRAKNALRPGDTTATGQILPDDTSAIDVLQEAVEAHGILAEAQASGTAPIAALACRSSFTVPASPASAR